jgi:hypothetical protein
VKIRFGNKNIIRCRIGLYRRFRSNIINRSRTRSRITSRFVREVGAVTEVVLVVETGAGLLAGVVSVTGSVETDVKAEVE